MSDVTFKKVTLYTDESDGRSKFRDENLEMVESGVIGFLSNIYGATGYQLRHSPVGYGNTFHSTMEPQWVFVLSGVMQIELRDGTVRDFKAGESFFSADTPPKADFPEEVVGHISREVGGEPLRTLFVKVP